METKKNNEFLVRTLSAAVFGGLMVCSMLFFPIFFGIVFLVFMVVALSEFYHISIGNLFPIPQTCAFVTAIVFYVLIFLFNCIGLSGRWLWATIIPLALIQVTTIFLSVNERRELSRFPYIYYGLGYIALPFSLSSFLAFRNGEFDCMLLLCFFILIWMNDIGAYLLGSTLGQRPNAKKLAPSISPKKSWVGFWSGMVFCIGSAIALKYIGLLDLLLALPERVKIRYVKFDATNADLLAKMNVTDDEMHDRYDATIDKYTSTDTNGVEQVKAFDEVKGEIEQELRKIAAVQYYETNLTSRAYGVKAAEGKSRLDEIAAEDGLKVEVSDWFTTDGGYVDGFMKFAGFLFPDADGLVDAVAQLDPESEDLRYGVVLGKSTAWLIERAEVSAAHVPSFEEAKSVIRPKALDAAKADAFKAKVEAIAKKGVAEVEKTPGISTNLTFSVGEMTPGLFDDQYAVAGAARTLAKGEVSEFTKTGRDTGVLVICVDRAEGDATKATILKSQVRDQLAMFQRRELPQNWLKWNLERLGFEPDASASVTPEETTDED